MKILRQFLDWLCRAYTVTSALMILLLLSLAGSFDALGGINPRSFLLILPFAAGIALANVIYTLDKMTHGVRLCMHAVICVLSAYLFLYLPSGTEGSTGMKFLMLLLVVLIYWLVMGIFLALSAAHRRAKPAGEEYQSVFKK